MILICEALQVGFRGSPMMEPHQIGRSLPQHSRKLTLDSGGYQAKGGAIYPFTAYQDAEILYMYIYLYLNMILICEALQVGFRGSPKMEPHQIGRPLPQHS